MSNEVEFVNGLIAKAPNENAPEYVKAKLSIRRQELIDWLSARDGDWINAEVKESKGGKWYIAVDSWKPNQDSGNGTPRSNGPATTQRATRATDVLSDEFVDENIPFISGRDRF